jgi:two-component system, OmpR family, sensor kinase
VTDAAQAEADRAEMVDAMRRMGDEAARMRRLVDGLLDLARLDDLGVVARDPVDLGVVVRDVASDLRVVAPDRVVTVAAPEALVVTGDRDRLTQALVGLTSNAVRHTPAGTPVWLSVVELPGSVRVDVADAGPGIPPEHLPHVFERFHRVDRGRSSSSGGTGLGLAIVAAIARAHGGSASVASQLGHGSTFSITLPA